MPPRDEAPGITAFQMPTPVHPLHDPSPGYPLPFLNSHSSLLVSCAWHYGYTSRLGDGLVSPLSFVAVAAQALDEHQNHPRNFEKVWVPGF